MALNGVTAKVENGVLVYRDSNGNVLTTAQARAAVASNPDAVSEKNDRDLRAKAQAALTANATYLAITNPTTAQNTAQVRALTRQVNALIRLTTRALDSQSGT